VLQAHLKLYASDLCGLRLKDGREVVARDGVVMTTDDNTYRLVIREARDSDAGVYKCVLRNSAGETACTATLSVQGQPFALLLRFC